MGIFDGRVIAITGASGGMGISTAHLLSSKGASLSLCDTNTARLQTLKDELGSPKEGQLYTIHAVNVADSAQVDDWIAETIKAHGRLDGAANLAGISGAAHGHKPLGDLTNEMWKEVMSVNCDGTMYALRAQLRVMKGQGGGAIVNCSSVAALRVTLGYSPYSISKQAVIGLTKVAAKDYGPHNIRVNAIAPGYVDTPMMKDITAGTAEKLINASLLKRVCHPDEIAELVSFLLSDASRFITGEVITIDGGISQ